MLQCNCRTTTKTRLNLWTSLQGVDDIFAKELLKSNLPKTDGFKFSYTKSWLKQLRVDA